MVVYRARVYGVDRWKTLDFTMHNGDEVLAYRMKPSPTHLIYGLLEEGHVIKPAILLDSPVFVGNRMIPITRQIDPIPLDGETMQFIPEIVFGFRDIKRSLQTHTGLENYVLTVYGTDLLHRFTFPEKAIQQFDTFVTPANRPLIGNYLRLLRKSSRFVQKEVAARLGVHVNTIRNLECGATRIRYEQFMAYLQIVKPELDFTIALEEIARLDELSNGTLLPPASRGS